MAFESGVTIKRGRLFVIGVLLVLASLSATLSANISINTNNTIEFGQGIKFLNACDDWIKITPRNGNDLENPYVKFVDIQGLDTSQCNSVNIKIEMYKTGQSGALALYSSTADTSTASTSLNIFVDSYGEVFINKNGTLPPPFGDLIAEYDNGQFLDLQFQSATSTYTVTFTYPAALVTDVNNVALQTSSQPDPD